MPDAPSDDEWDISKSLLPARDVHSDDLSGDDHNRDHDHAPNETKASHDDIGAYLDVNGDDEAFIATQQSASNRKASNLKGRSVKKGGGFQAMGLNLTLLKAITRKGFSVPTPIQRKSIPLIIDGQDVVGMARTGSGKTAAFVIPMIEKLKTHSAKVGLRALILSPSRELALQTLKVVKELGRGTELRTVLLVGGDSLEDQFGFMAANPDIVIATPGRFLHLQVEMGLDLSSVRYVVFDEADRLFEMGFAAQLAEILHALPPSRQTLLFSATLPKSLVEFAKAGLQDPSLIRLDAESKVSPDLESAFFTVKTSEKEGALLYVLNHVINMPMGPPAAAVEDAEQKTESKKRKRNIEGPKPTESPTAHSTIVFVATKHHVEYLATLLRNAGFAVSHAYGSLDQVARRTQVQDFRSGATNILVVTDVAARGIDIPILANVINYDFPAQPKIFVHRVGRTARAGKRGRSYSLVTESDAPYLLDLQLFLGRALVLGDDGGEKADLAQELVVGGIPRNDLGRSCELASKLVDEETELAALLAVAAKGERLYVRTRNHASMESAKRAKAMVGSTAWMTNNRLFSKQQDVLGKERESMLARVSNFRPQETVFEIGKRGNGGEAAEIMKRRRETIGRRKNNQATSLPAHEEAPLKNEAALVFSEYDEIPDPWITPDRKDDRVSEQGSASEDELEVTYTQLTSDDGKPPKDVWKDSKHFMSYTPVFTNEAEDRAYGVQSGSYNPVKKNTNFAEVARGATLDLTNDEGAKAFAEPSRGRGLRWDKKGKKYVAKANDEDGSKGKAMIKSESGQKIAASFRSGRFDAWRKSNRIARLPRTGEMESSAGSSAIGKRFKHKLERAPKEADRFRDDYYTRRIRVKEAKEKRVGKFRDGDGRPELRSLVDVQKQRRLKEKRREKTGRPSKRRKA